MKNLCLVTCFILLSGCSVLDFDGKNVSKFGAADLFKQPIEDIDLISIITKSEVNSKGLSPKDFSGKFDAVLASYTPANTLERNRIQDRIIMASNELCESYKITLKKKQSKNNFWWGAAATTFGAAGSVINGAHAAKNLSALSGLSSGVRAEYNQSYFSDVASQVITKGINARRSEILEKIMTAKKATLEEYTVENAIADAITYHGACSLIAGLEQADSAITKLNTTNNVGLDALNANAIFKAKVSDAGGGGSSPTTPQ